MKHLDYGNVPVPMTTEWGREAGYSIAHCPHAGGLALCQPSRQGEAGDRPAFGRQHFNRQRRAAVLGLCDLCGKPLKGRTKLSLSEPVFGSNGATLMQLEPLVHRECAEISMGACPHLRAARAAGKLKVRTVTRFRSIPDILAPKIVAEQAPEYTGPRVGIAGYVFIELLQWTEAA